MKKFLLVAIAVFALVSMNAQERKLEYGFKSGLNLSTLSGDIGYINKRTFFHLGVVFEIPLSSSFALQPEMMYSGQGYISTMQIFYNDYGMGVSLEREIGTPVNMGYLLVPFMLKYYTAKGFNFQMGPQMGFLLSAKLKGEVFDYVYYDPNFGDFVFELKEIERNLMDEFHKFDFGLNFGAGYSFEHGLFFEGRYNYGLVNVKKSISKFRTNNSVFQFSVGYKF